jgi:hypothetical protein
MISISKSARNTGRDNGREPGNPFAFLARVAVGVLL